MRKLIIPLLNPRMILMILVGFLVLGYLIYQLNFLISPPKLKIINPAQDFISLSQKTIEIIGQTSPEAQLTINGQPVYNLSKDGNFKETVNLGPGLNTLEIKAVNRFGKTNSVIRRILVK